MTYLKSIIVITLFLFSQHLMAMPKQAKTLHEFCQGLKSGKFSGVENIPQVLVMRGCAWMHAGIVDKDSEPLLLSAAAKGHGRPASPEWVKAFTTVGDLTFNYAESAKSDDEKAKNYELASHFYYLARWPHTFSPQAQAAYQKHVIAYRKAGSYLNPPIQELNIPYNGKNIVAHLRMPKSDKPLPLIVLSPGIDDWKGEMNDFIIPMLKAGFATLVIDLPGTGQSEFKLAPESYKVFSAAIAYGKKLPGIDGERIGFYGLSGGGHFAVAMAMTDPNIKASVNVGGPVHSSFTSEWLNVTPQSILATITYCAGHNLRTEDKQSVINKMLPISLLEQGVLKPRANGPKLLTINGENDILAAPDEYRIIDKLGIDQDMLIFENDGHVAPAHFDIHIPFSIDWLKKHLAVK